MLETTCAWCGTKYEAEDKELLADHISGHARICEKSPLATCIQNASYALAIIENEEHRRFPEVVACLNNIVNILE